VAAASYEARKTARYYADIEKQARHRNAYHIQPVKPSRRPQPGSAALFFSRIGATRLGPSGTSEAS
jgi:hypothetical protein